MKDDLLGNKIFGAVMGTLLLLFGLRQISEMVFATHPPAKAGYHIAVQEAASDAGPVADTPPDWGTVLTSADAAAGAVTANKCKACHNFDNGGPNMTGPNLWGVIGRKPGSHPGFAYSAAMLAFGAKVPVWDFQHVYEFVAGPQAYLDGTKMSFVGLKQRQDRINVIAWLRSQSSSPVAIPPANPAAAPAAKAPASAAAGTSPTAAPNTVAATPASAGAGSKPVSVNGAAPSSSQTASSTGVTPNAGAAAAPTRITNESPGGPPR